MKTKKYCLILAVVTGILCVSALGKVELHQEQRRGLIGQANPTLAGIKELYVFVVPPDAEPDKDGLVPEKLQMKVESKLREGGVRCVKPRSLPTPELKVYIDMLKLPDSQKYVFRIKTSLTRAVILPTNRNLHLKTDVWETKPQMQVASVKNMPVKITDLVIEQVETFISAYLAANPQGKQPADANDISTAPKEQAKPDRGAAVAKYEYVASKNSKVFHKADCSSAKRIRPENLVGYNSRDEAIKAGKRPCKRCKP